MKQANAVENSENKKLGSMSTTYAAIGSCPNSCPFLKSGACYGMSGPISIQWRKLDGDQSVSIARAEAAAIDSLSGKKHLRIHTLGDCRTNTAAKLVAAAADRYMMRGGMRAFTFTHAWRDVSRESWGKVSVLASCETTAEVKAAKEKGFATALVVAEHKQETAYEVDGVKILPCPQQTGRAETCDKCKLCLHDDRLKAANITIAFKPHGPTLKAKKMLEEKAAS